MITLTSSQKSPTPNISGASVYWHDYILTVTACLAPDFLCGDGVCLDSSKICDGLMDCSDGTDESNDQCNGKKHLCNQATVWIEQ